MPGDWEEASKGWYSRLPLAGMTHATRKKPAKQQLAPENHNETQHLKVWVLREVFSLNF
jgi:hypothetical protein